MIKIYNCLGSVMKSQLKNDVGDAGGAVPGAPKATSTSWLTNLLLLAIMLAGVNVWAQIPAYSFSQSSGVYTPISGGTNLASTSAANLDDNSVTALPIGFTFNYGGTDFTTFGFNANGWITMGSGVATSSYVPISVATPVNIVSAFGVDIIGRQNFVVNATSGSATLTVTAGNPLNLVTGTTLTGTGIPVGATVVSTTATTITMSAAATSTGTARFIPAWDPNAGIRYETIGVAPNRQLVVQWTAFSRYSASTSNGDKMNFQIVLNETSNNVNIIYNFATPNATGSITPQVGLKGSSNTVFNNRTSTTSWSATTAGTANTATVTYSNTVLPASGLTYTWTPPVACTGTPVAGTIAPASQTVCQGVTPGTLTLSGYSSGVAGLAFLWEQSTDGGSSWATATGTGGTTATFTPGAYSGTSTLYRAVVTCTASGLSANSATAVVNPQASPTTAASAITFTPTLTNATIAWTNGNGNRRYVVVNTTNSFTNPVGTGDVVVAGTVYTSGERIVYDGTGTSVAITGLTANTTYYARVYEYNRCVGTPNVNYYNTATATNNPNSFLFTNNDNCVDAITLNSCTGGTQTKAGSTTGATVDTYIDCGATGTANTQRGVWYKYVGDNSNVTITTCNSVGYDTRLTVYSGACGSFNCVAGNDDMVPTCTFNSSTYNFRSEVNFNAVAGTDYYILVHGYQTLTTLSAVGDFILTYNCTALCTPIAGNDECTAATPLTLGTALATNNTCASGSIGVTYPSCSPNQFATHYDTWYSFNSGSNTTLEFSSVSVSPAVVGFAVYSGACGTLTQVGCNATGIATNVTLTANTNYYIRAFSTTASERGNFTLAVKVPCLAPTNLTAANITPTTADLSWTGPSPAPGSGYEYAVTTSATPPASGTPIAGTTYSASNLTAGTIYYLHVRSVCSPGNFSPWATKSFRYLIGDNCALAINLAALTSPLNGDTTGATDDFTNTCAGGNTSPDLVYYIDVPNGFTLVIGQTVNDYDSENTLFYGGACPGTTQIACFDDADIQNITWQNTTGSTQRAYWVQDGYFDNTTFGTFTLAWTLTAPPITISSFTPTTACSADLENVDVILTGINFTDVTDVQLNGISMPFDINSGTQITVHLTSAATTGTFVVYNAVTSDESDSSFTVTPNPTVALITGPSFVCLPAGNTITLTNSTPTGIWDSSDDDIATIDASGIVTAVSAGTVTITYTVTDTGCSTTQSYVVSVNNPVVISASTATQTVAAGSDTTFSVTASGTPSGNNSALGYQWQVSTDGLTFTDLTDNAIYGGTTSAILTLTDVPLSLDGSIYRAVISGACNFDENAVISEQATLNVGETGIITPPSNFTVCGSGTATFTVVASEDVTSYQWQEDQGGGDNWLNIPEGGMYSGTDTATLTISGVTLADSGNRYRVNVTGLGSAQSSPATLTVVPAATITNPVNQTVCYTGGSATFSVSATGTITSYQWQYSSNGGASWSNVANGTPGGTTYTGAATASLNVTTTAATPPGGTYSYRVIANSAGGCPSATSNAASLIINNPIVTVTPPSATFCNPGSPVTLTASGATTYSWSPATGLSATSGATVTANPTQTTTYTVTGTSAGCSSSTNVTVTVSPTVNPTVTAPKTTVCPGESLVLTASGAPAGVAGYAFTSTTGTYAQVSAGATALATVRADDAIGPVTNIGFNFAFSGTTYTQFRMSSNGFISFNTAASTTASNNMTTAAAAIRPLLAPLWDDQDGAVAGTFAGYEVTGSSPNRVLTVEWRGWEWNYLANAPVISYQVKLYETSNQIEYVYRSEANPYTFGTNNTLGASIGLVGTGTGSGSFLSLSGVASPTASTTTETSTITTKPATGTIFRFTPPPTYTYAWSSVPAGFTSSSATPTVNPTVNTTYNVVVTSSAGCVGNGSIAIAVESGATITTQPAAQTVCQGQPASFTVAATGASITYQWRRNGVNLTNTAPFSGVTTATLTISSAAVANAGDYDVVVTPSCGGAVTSTLVALTVNALPVITTQPTAPTAVCATAGTATISVVATGAATYQWRRAGINLTNSAVYSGVNSATLTITNPAVADGGSFDVVVSSAAGCSVTSNAVNFTVNPAPPVTTGATVCQGGSGTLTATVTCTGFSNSGTTFTGSWPAGAPTANKPNSSTDSATCGFGTDQRNYAITEFQVSVAGSYVFEMNNNIDYDGMAYLVSGAFVPGNCSGGGTFIKGDDDSSAIDNEPRLTATLAPGVTYKMITTLWLPAAPYVGTFGYTVTPPAGGQIMLPAPTSDVVWYTAASGGTSIGSGSPFNPVGVSGSGLADTNTPGTTTFYAACSGNTGCRTAAAFTINANVTYYTDADGDGYGSTSSAPIVSCTGQPANTSVNNTDCNDNIAAINPGAPEILYDGVDNNCNNQLDEGNQLKTKLLASVCGTTLTSINSIIGITTVGPAITRYRIRVVNGAQVQIIEKNVPNFFLTELPFYDYATTYTVDIELQRNGIWLGYYGDTCLVSSPAILASNGAAQISPSQCGITLARLNTLVATTSIQGVTAYRFRVTNLTNTTGPNVVQTIDRSLHWFSLNMLTQYNYGTLYRVEVAVQTNGAFSGFGSPCEVSSPASPTLVNCGGTIAAANTNISATSLPNVTQYRFQITRMSDNSVTTIDRNTNFFQFSMVPGYTPAAQYAVRVAVMTVGTWSPFGDACEITSPGTAGRFIAEDVTTPTAQLFKAAAYPNPFASSFAVDVTTSAQDNVQIKVYDMAGRLIEVRESNVSDVKTLQVGDRYPSGVYNVVVTQGANVETLRVIKR